VHGHFGAESGDLGRPAGVARCFVAQPPGPLCEHGARGLPQALHGARIEAVRQGNRGQPRSMQDFIGVGVADPGKQLRVCQRALERVVLGHQAL
jgi:hypothetical protein